MELEKQKQRQEDRKNQTHEPYRFYMKPGDKKDIIVVDDEPSFFRYEHNMKDARTGKWSVYTGCVHETETCPVCEHEGKESYYAMFLTVIDLTPYTNKDNETVEFTKKLLVVKPAQQKKFLRRFEKDGTLRGALFEMNRDGDKDSSIGNDIEFVEFVEEEELETYVRTWVDREKKKHTELCSEVYDYDNLFPPADAETLRQLVGGGHAPGSRRGNRETLDTPTGAEDGSWEEEGADVPWEGEAEPRSRSRAGRAAAPTDAADEDTPPARRVRPGARREVAPAEPTRSARRTVPRR